MEKSTPDCPALHCTDEPRMRRHMEGRVGSFSRLTYHLVFGTKFRRKLINDQFRERLYSYTGGIIRSQNGHLVEVGGIEDHIHILMTLAPSIALAEIVRAVKSCSAKWLNQVVMPGRRFQWQTGYGAFTVGYSQIDRVRRYIQNQREHHRRLSFRREYIELLERHDIPYETRYLFEGEHVG